MHERLRRRGRTSPGHAMARGRWLGFRARVMVAHDDTDSGTIPGLPDTDLGHAAKKYFVGTSVGTKLLRPPIARKS